MTVAEGTAQGNAAKTTCSRPNFPDTCLTPAWSNRSPSPPLVPQAEFLGLVRQALKGFFRLLTLRRLIAKELFKGDAPVPPDLAMLQTPLLDLLDDERPGYIQKVCCFLR